MTESLPTFSSHPECAEEYLTVQSRIRKLTGRSSIRSGRGKRAPEGQGPQGTGRNGRAMGLHWITPGARLDKLGLPGVGHSWVARCIAAVISITAPHPRPIERAK